MPYTIRKYKTGYRVYSPSGALSKKPLSKKRAESQKKAVEIRERSVKKSR